MGVPKDLYPKRGDLVKVWANKVLAWAHSLEVVLGGEDLQKTVTSSGTTVTYVTSNPWVHPFQVSASTEEAVVNVGEVNGLMPVVEGVKLDGLDEDGKQLDTPRLSIAAPNAGLASWVCLIAVIDPATGELLEEDGAAPALSVEHRLELPTSIRQGGSPDEDATAVFPLARLKWAADKTSIAEIFQIVHHNLGHRFLPAKNEGPGRHFFWGV